MKMLVIKIMRRQMVTIHAIYYELGIALSFYICEY